MEQTGINPFEGRDDGDEGLPSSPSSAPASDDGVNPFAGHSADQDEKIAAPTPAHHSTASAQPQDDDLSLTDALGQAAHNIGPDFIDMVKGIPQGVKELPNLAKGLVSKGAGLIGVDQGPEKKAETEALVDAIGHHYKETYGSWSGFKHELAAHPAGIISDAAPLVTEGLGAAAKVPGMLGKAAGIASKVSDPASVAATAASLPAEGLNAVAKYPLAPAAGVSKASLDMAQKAGSSTDPALRDAFQSHLNGSASPTEILDTAQRAFKKAKAEKSAEYVGQKAAISANQVTPSFNNIDQAVTQARSITQPGGINHPSVFPKANQALDETQAAVDQFRNTPSLHNLEGFDTLKQAIGNIRDRYGSDDVANRVMGGVYTSARDAIGNVNPEYFDLMDNYQSGLNELKNIRSTAGLNSQVASTAVRKMVKQLGGSDSQSVLGDLSEHEPSLPYMLAGAELNPWHHRGWRALVDLGAAGVAAGALHPSALAGLATTSPRLMGKLQYGIGAAGRAAASPVGKALKYGVGETARQDVEDQDQNQPDDLTRATLMQESGNGKTAPGNVGQIQPQTWSQYARYGERIDDSNDNRNVTGRIIKDYLKRFGGDPRRAATAYFSGPDNVAPSGSSTPWIEDRHDKNGKSVSSYVSDIEDKMRTTRALGGRVMNYAAEADHLIDMAHKGLKQQGKRTEHILGMHDDHVTAALKAADKYI